MLAVLVAVAMGNRILGWPCSRMNWAWRNVWSTCSITSYAPTNVNTQDYLPAHFRRLPLTTAMAPTSSIQNNGVVLPATGAALPAFQCSNFLATGSDHLRNRCRRALDAYGEIVRQCRLSPADHPFRGPVVGSVFPDWAPVGVHEPHVTNVNRLAAHSQACWEVQQPGAFRSPATTCPGLLGWFTVVWNACRFAEYAPNANPHAPLATPNFAPLGAGFTHARLFSGPIGGGNPSFFVCSPAPTGGPNAWMRSGPSFRTSRCRRAMDQFGRTALRCNVPQTGGVVPAPVLGVRDPLKIFAGYPMNVPTAGAAMLPMGLNSLAPLCNSGP